MSDYVKKEEMKIYFMKETKDIVREKVQQKLQKIEIEIINKEYIKHQTMISSLIRRLRSFK